MGHLGRRLIGDEHLDHHLAGGLGAGAVGRHDHAIRRLANAGRNQGPLTLDLNHTGAAIAVGAIARSGLVAQMGDHQATAVGDFPDG